MAVDAAAWHAGWLRPRWPRPEALGSRVGALMTTRQGGCSAAPFDSLNLRDGLGDDDNAAGRNRQTVARAIGASPVYLHQVHGCEVVRLWESDACAGAAAHEADASVTDAPGLACAVQVADCLPVLFAAPGGHAVGAAHAGWRGLAAGVLEATLVRVGELAGCAPREVQAWLGPCIGPQAFEVGADVLEAFGDSPLRRSRRFVAKREGKWLADLPGLARDRLHAAGVEAIGGEASCTVGDASRFFSFRRDGRTGRMAGLVWIRSALGR